MLRARQRRAVVFDIPHSRAGAITAVLDREIGCRVRACSPGSSGPTCATAAADIHLRHLDEALAISGRARPRPSGARVPVCIGLQRRQDEVADELLTHVDDVRADSTKREARSRTTASSHSWPKSSVTVRLPHRAPARATRCR